MKLPNGEKAVVDIIKLREYCLSRTHARGKHKAHVFERVLGLTADRAEDLREALLLAARNQDAVLSGSDEYGERYVIDFEMTRGGATAGVRSSWIVLSGEDFARLTSCYVLKR